MSNNNIITSQTVRILVGKILSESTIWLSNTNVSLSFLFYHMKKQIFKQSMLFVITKFLFNVALNLSLFPNPLLVVITADNDTMR